MPMRRSKSVAFSSARQIDEKNSETSSSEAENQSRFPTPGPTSGRSRRCLFPSDSDTNHTVISISDSDYSSDAETVISPMTPDEEEFFSSTSDAFAEESWVREIENFTTWSNQTCRKLVLMNELAKQTGKATPESLTPGFRMLQTLLDEIVTTNQNAYLRFDTLFDLMYILKNHCPGMIVTSSALVKRIKKILEMFLLSPSLQKDDNPAGSMFLQNYLRDRYNAECTSVLSIYRQWKSSYYFNEKLLDLIKSDRRYLSAYYFGILMNYLDDRLKAESQNLTSILELGMTNIEELESFLVKFSIPHAGPFKRITKNGARIQMFISAVNPADSVVNNMVPLYGVYEFRLSCLNKTPDLAQIHVNKLSVAPSWLVLYPPLFHGSLVEMRRQITYV